MDIKNYLYRLGVIKVEVSEYMDKGNGAYLVRMYSVFNAFPNIVKSLFRKYYTGHKTPMVLTCYRYMFSFVIPAKDMDNNALLKELKKLNWISYDGSLDDSDPMFSSDFLCHTFNIISSLNIQSNILAFYNSLHAPRLLLSAQSEREMDRVKNSLSTLPSKKTDYTFKKVPGGYLLTLYPLNKKIFHYKEQELNLIPVKYLDKMMYIDAYILENKLSNNGEIVALMKTTNEMLNTYRDKFEKDESLDARVDELLNHIYLACKSEVKRRDDFEQLRLEADFEGIEAFLKKV